MATKGKVKAAAKAEEKQTPQLPMGVLNYSVFVGDDTGLLKRLSVSLSQVDDVISQPSQRQQRRQQDPLDTEALEEALTTKEELKDEPVIRKRPLVEFKLAKKSGTQAKDEGLLYLRWLGSQGDYLSYLRGKSNVVQVYDKMTDTVWAQKQYQLESPIKGLGTLGKDIFDLRHVLVSEKGRLIVD